MPAQHGHGEQRERGLAAERPPPRQARAVRRPRPSTSTRRRRSPPPRRAGPAAAGRPPSGQQSGTQATATPRTAGSACSAPCTSATLKRTRPGRRRRPARATPVPRGPGPAWPAEAGEREEQQAGQRVAQRLGGEQGRPRERRRRRRRSPPTQDMPAGTGGEEGARHATMLRGEWSLEEPMRTPMRGTKGVDFLQLHAPAPPRGGVAAWLVDALRAAIADGQAGRGAGCRHPGARRGSRRVPRRGRRGVPAVAPTRACAVGRTGARGTASAGRAARRAPPRPAGAAAAAAGLELDLSPGLPDLSAFPRAAWLRADAAVLAVAAADLGYGDPRGTPAARRAGRLARPDPGRAGRRPTTSSSSRACAQALALLAQVLRDPRGRRGRGRGPGLARAPARS